jgi:hypothetical protein
MLSSAYPSFSPSLAEAAPCAGPNAANDQEPQLEPTVFLPGLLCDQSLWQNQVEALADVCAPMIANLTLDDTVEAMARRTLAAAPPASRSPGCRWAAMSRWRSCGRRPSA